MPSAVFFFVLLHEGEEQGTVLAVADGASVVAEHDLLKLVEDGARKTASDDAEIKGGYHAPDHTIAMRRGLSVGEHLRLKGMTYGMSEVERTA